MTIGEAARRSGLSSKTIRYYEDIGLVSPARSANGYRDYGPGDLRQLGFLHRARGLGFTVDECRHLLALYADKHRASAEVKRLAGERLKDIEARIRRLEALRDSLTQLVGACHGDARPDCPIIDELATGGQNH
jgi:Cu(I)-responsive transcriptional regulator